MSAAVLNPVRALGSGLDSTLVSLSLVLLLTGFVAVTSASIEYDAAAAHGNPLYHSTRHLVYMALALSAAAAVYTVPMTFWYRSGWMWLFVGLALLLLVLIPGIGITANGSRRWIGFGPLTLQASEFAKIFLIIYLAGYLQRRQAEVQSQ